MRGRDSLAEGLRGDGIELGPGHHPFALPAGTRVQYVDRWIPEENRSLYPELPAGVDFPHPDIVANFDTDQLRMISSKSQDFVICSHVLEHLANPIALLRDMYRVLRPGGLAVILLPDLRRTFDRNRPATPLAHLLAEYAAGVTVVDDDHIIDFLTHAGVEAAFTDMPSDREERDRFFEWHRKRSIHVHCWTEDDFAEVLRHCVERLGHRWEIITQLPTGDGIEFGYLLRRAKWPRGRRFTIRAPRISA